nr:retrovirus-related Pol polyprotein from transposon TNT 1-94 [Tanacetum cinerariifolium]
MMENNEVLSCASDSSVPRGIFIIQSQYTLEILKKHGMDGCDSISTPMATARIDADLQGNPTDPTTTYGQTPQRGQADLVIPKKNL